jgi:hypothetical protein
VGESPVEILERWEDHGAQWRVVALGDEHVSIDLCTCYGEPVDRIDSSDPALLEWLRDRRTRDGEA